MKYNVTCSLSSNQFLHYLLHSALKTMLFTVAEKKSLQQPLNFNGQILSFLLPIILYKIISTEC